jgi:hypothetical protein
MQATDKPKRHHYSLKIISMLSKIKLDTSSSFRAIVKTFSITKLYLECICETPAHSTVINWVHKIGYYHLSRNKEVANDWIIILDHSIQFGQDKAIVVLGIRESAVDFTRPLRFQDLVPLRIESRKKWTGQSIAEYLTKLKSEIGNIKYAVGDHGNDIKKGLKLSEITHIHDITHAIALILENVYRKDPQYQGLSKQMSEMRNKFLQTDIAHIIPPNQRTKSRYLNIKTISDWGKSIINFLDNSANPCKKIDQELEWFRKYHPFIEELSEINRVICGIEKIVKSKGLCEVSILESKSILDELLSLKGEIVKQKLIKYFEEMQDLIKTEKSILCTSDILESAFGKYKNYVSNNPMAGITNLVLCIAAFTSSLQDDEVKEALERTTIRDIKNWTNEFIGKTLLQKRREAFAYA